MDYNIKRIKSRNPHRTEENKDSFDYAMGMFIVQSEFHWNIFRYTGNNMQESKEQRQLAKREAEKYIKPFEQLGIKVNCEEIKY